MNPADKLIVALDQPAIAAIASVRRLLGTVVNFKLGVSAFLWEDGLPLARLIVHEGAGLMLDLKLYDTRDTVLRTMEAAQNLGARWVTVHADCLEPATGFRPKILAVSRLTDGTGTNAARSTQSGFTREHEALADGLVCSVHVASKMRSETTKLLVCPGIRLPSNSSDNHLRPATPRKAIEAGADYIVVGRPIYQAVDSVGAARAIIDEIAAATHPAFRMDNTARALPWRP